MDPFLPSRSEDSLYFLTVDNTIEICIAHEWLWETVKKKTNKQTNNCIDHQHGCLVTRFQTENTVIRDLE